MPDELWVVPGTPLQDGSGWRLWYSHRGTGDFAPPVPRVVRVGGGAVQPAVANELLAELDGLDRRVAIQTLALPAGEGRGTTYDVTVPGVSGTFRWQTLPATIEDGLTFFMCSCFWRNDDGGHYAARLAELHKLHPPAFKMMMGDQLYCDVPLHVSGSHEEFAESYVANWSDTRYQPVLRASPNLFACDDHEFWNNYPDRQLHIAYTVSAEARANAKRAALAYFEHFQHSANRGGRRFFRLDVAPVSIFVSDSRSERTPFEDAEPRFFSDEQWDELEDWADSLEGPGLLVLSQPLFQEPGGGTDRSLQDFREDHRRLMRLFERALDRNHDIAVLTGDIHTGRHAVAAPAGRPGTAVHEFVASPASLVVGLSPRHKAKPPPATIRGARPFETWAIVGTEGEDSPTAANNVGVVRLAPGRNGRVRLEFQTWRLRREKSPWNFWRRDPPVPGDGVLRPTLYKEVELR
jgi:hypothetical protein